MSHRIAVLLAALAAVALVLGCQRSDRITGDTTRPEAQGPALPPLDEDPLLSFSTFAGDSVDVMAFTFDSAAHIFTAELVFNGNADRNLIIETDTACAMTAVTSTLLDIYDNELFRFTLEATDDDTIWAFTEAADGDYIRIEFTASASTRWESYDQDGDTLTVCYPEGTTQDDIDDAYLEHLNRNKSLPSNPDSLDIAVASFEPFVDTTTAVWNNDEGEKLIGVVTNADFHEWRITKTPGPGGGWGGGVADEWPFLCMLALDCAMFKCPMGLNYVCYACVIGTLVCLFIYGTPS